MTGKERYRSIELAPQLVHAYAQTFIPRWNCFHQQLPDGKYVQINRPLTLTDVFKHLTEFHAGRKPYTIGAYMLNEHNQGNKLCLDADTPEHWQELLKLALALERQSIPVYPELSARGGHVWFFTPLLSGADLRRFGQQLLAEYKVNVWDEAKKRQKIELYPKQPTIGEGVGSLMRLPFGMHLVTKKVYPFITADGQPLALTLRDQIALLGNPNRVSPDFIQALLAQAPPTEEKVLTPTPPFEKQHLHNYGHLSEALKHTISVYDFVSRYIELDHSGKGFCPFHDDQKKSFHVNRPQNYWHCYAGCLTPDGKKGGSLIDFWATWRQTHGEDGSFKATVLELREMLLE